MIRYAIRTIMLSVGFMFSCGALAQAETHSDMFFENIDLLIRAKECVEPERLCRSLRQRVKSAACYPPILESTHAFTRDITVTGRIFVGEDGRVKRIDITQSSNLAALDKAIAESLPDCRLGILTKDGQPISSSFEVEWTLRDNVTTISRRRRLQ